MLGKQPRDDQVFLIMGIAEDSDDTVVAIVVARDEERARKAYIERTHGAFPMSWPSLEDIKQSARWLEGARDGATGNLPGDVCVIDDRRR